MSARAGESSSSHGSRPRQDGRVDGEVRVRLGLNSYLRYLRAVVALLDDPALALVDSADDEFRPPAEAVGERHARRLNGE